MYNTLKRVFFLFLTNYTRHCELHGGILERDSTAVLSHVCAIGVLLQIADRTSGDEKYSIRGSDYRNMDCWLHFSHKDRARFKYHINEKWSDI